MVRAHARVCVLISVASGDVRVFVANLGAGGVQCASARAVISLDSPESHNPGWPIGEKIWTKMKCPRDTAFPLCWAQSDHRLSAPFTDLCLLDLLHCHCGYTLSASLIWLFINYNVDCRLEGHELCQTAYWHFYGHDFVFLPFKLMFFWDRCLIYEGCKVIWSPKSQNGFELCFLNV